MNYWKTKVICALFSLSGFLYWQNNGLMLTRITHFKNVPKELNGYKILQVSDLQNKIFGTNQNTLINKIMTAAPDIIVITGDLIDRNRTDLNAAISFVEKAVKIAPVYYVSGNHEHQSGCASQLYKLLVASGVKILENRKSMIQKNSASLEIIGLADKRVNPYFNQALQTLLKGRKNTSFRILLSHRPELFEFYVQEDVDLAFTGHAHGGQIRLPFVGGIFAPNQGFFPAYTIGTYEKNNTTMVVSRGLGNSTFPFRIFNRPELVLVTLWHKNF